MGIANIVNTAGGGGGSSEIITHLVNSVDGAGLRLANQGYISCADVSANRFGTNDFSVEFVLSQETNAINADIFISNLNGSNQAVDAAVIRWDVIQNDNIQLVFTNSGATETAYNFGYDPAPDLNEPTHYLVSADRSGNAVLYRNGAEIASVSIAASGSANVGNSGQPTVIGSPVNNFGVKGNVYRFRTYSKALSPDEAKNVFDRADVPTALVSNLLLDLDCAYANPTQSAVIQDRGPNNQDGTLNGTITQTNVIKQLNSTSARIGTSAGTPEDRELLLDKFLTFSDNGGTITSDNAEGEITIAGGNATNNGGNISLRGGSHGTPNTIRMRVGGSTAMTIDSSGKTTSKAADNVFTVQDTEDTVADANAEVRIGESDASGNLNNYWGLKFAGTASGGDLNVNRNGTTALTIASNGQVNITGTKSFPETSEHPLTVQAGMANGLSNRYIKLKQTYTGSAKDGIPIVWETNADGDDNKSYGYIRTKANGTVAIGNRAAGAAVAVGTALGTTEHLTIDSTGLATFNNSLKAVSTTSGAGCIETRQEGGSGSRYHCVFRENGTERGSITSNGSATSYNTSSDYRLKENLEPLTGALDRIDQLPVYRFNFTSDPDTTVDGFVAHEVQAHVPEAVTGEKDAMRTVEIPAVLDEDGNEVEAARTEEQPDYQGIDQSKLVPLLVAAVKELKAKVETLENA
jgi:hypothetical protein